MQRKSNDLRDTYDMSFEIKSLGDDGIIEGYGSITDDEPDSYGDIIEKGAFAETIKNNGRNKNGIVMLWNHNPNDPIGKWDYMEEDSKGLYVKGTFDLEVQRAREVHSLAKKKIIKGLSIGYDAKDYEYDQKTKLRHLKEIELWEISPVTFPAKISANIGDVKNFEDAKTVRELERLLRDSGLSRKQSLYISNLCKQSFPDLRDSEDEEESVAYILNELKKVNNQFK